MSEGWTLRRAHGGYPRQLLDLDGLAGERAPAQLFGRGSRELVAGLEAGKAVTIVGARRCSGYGRAVAAELAGSLAAAGLVVVSGMAFGIDQAAHRGALDAGGLTLAVLAGGPDRAYPPSSRSIHRRIMASGGAVVSESAPGYAPHRFDFPRRNRIMAALAAMTIVVEARDPSGSRITADRALELSREVGALPGPVTSPLSAGPHALIRDGAHLVRDAQDVLDQVLGVGARFAERVGPELDEDSERTLAVVGTGESFDSVAAGAALDAARTAVALARLELLGYVRAEAGRYARTGLVPPPAHPAA
ncbi:MAG: DNA-processing protein DprA [Solirubrobacterales bacterium]